jgi:adenine-specific DNA-methyltransferase
MDKLKMHSPNLTQDNIARIAELFPDCVTEAKGEDGTVKLAVDFDQLRQELADSVVEGPQERYHLNWPGKREALLSANAPIAKTLRPCRGESVDFDTTKNLFIEGDNLDALKLLQENYLGAVDLIYIDPPYNTGKDFVYTDNFASDVNQYFKESMQISDDKSRLVFNVEGDGRFHSRWLSFMYSRLKLARNLLSDGGVIFISIDDNESANLRKLCDEIFGESNNLVTHYIQVRYAGKTLAEKNDYQKLVEQVLVYKKSTHEPIKEMESYSIDGFKFSILEKSSGKRETIGGRNVEIFPPGTYEIQEISPSVEGLKETWATGSVLKVNASGKFFGNYLAPRKSIDGLGVLYKVYGIGEDGLGYRYFTGPKRESATKGTFFSGVPTTRRKDIESGGSSNKAKSIVNFYDFADAFGNCRHEGDVGFRGGKKPVKFIETLIRQGCSSGIVLDFFAGSASTGHAIMKANLEDGGDRRFILVQIPEAINESEKDLRDEFGTISQLAQERLRRAGKQLKATAKDGARLDIGFRVFKIDTSNMTDVYYAPDALDKANLDLFVDNIKPDRTPEDLLFQVMLDWGVDLALPIARKSIQGKDVFFVDGNVLAACFDASGSIDEIFVKELAKRLPLRAVFRDAGFKDSAVKINVEQIFKLLSPATEVKCI